MDLESSGRVAGNLERPSRGRSRPWAVDLWAGLGVAAAVAAGYVLARATGLTRQADRLLGDPPGWTGLTPEKAAKVIPNALFVLALVTFVAASVLTYRYLCFRWIKNTMALREPRPRSHPPEEGPAAAAAPDCLFEPAPLEDELGRLDDWKRPPAKSA
jgi:hypothetical protein